MYTPPTRVRPRRLLKQRSVGGTPLLRCPCRSQDDLDELGVFGSEVPLSLSRSLSLSPLSLLSPSLSLSAANPDARLVATGMQPEVPEVAGGCREACPPPKSSWPQSGAREREGPLGVWGDVT